MLQEQSESALRDTHCYEKAEPFRRKHPTETFVKWPRTIQRPAATEEEAL